MTVCSNCLILSIYQCISNELFIYTALGAYLKLYQAGGMEALKQLNFYRPQSRLSEQRETLEAHLRAHPPHTVNEAIAVIEALTGIRRSPTQIRVFLKRLGLKCLKVGLLLAKGNPEEQGVSRKKASRPSACHPTWQQPAIPMFFAKDYHRYLDCLREVAKRHDGEIHAYVLRPTLSICG
jgi:transposase